VFKGGIGITVFITTSRLVLTTTFCNMGTGEIQLYPLVKRCRIIKLIAYRHLRLKWRNRGHLSISQYIFKRQYLNKYIMSEHLVKSMTCEAQV
jgi:hypothetical protein